MITVSIGIYFPTFLVIAQHLPLTFTEHVQPPVSIAFPFQVLGSHLIFYLSIFGAHENPKCGYINIPDIGCLLHFVLYFLAKTAGFCFNRREQIHQLPMLQRRSLFFTPWSPRQRAGVSGSFGVAGWWGWGSDQFAREEFAICNYCVSFVDTYTEACLHFL